VPAFVPFTFHWYDGTVPPLTGVAVKETVDPAQKGLEDATMASPAGRFGSTVMITWFDMAGFPEEQASEDNSEQVTTSPFTGG
jgi:hypothetical protein